MDGRVLLFSLLGMHLELLILNRLHLVGCGMRLWEIGRGVLRLEKCCRQMVLDAYRSWKAGIFDLLLWWSWFLKFKKDIIEFVTGTFHIFLVEFLAAVMVPCLAWITCKKQKNNRHGYCNYLMKQVQPINCVKKGNTLISTGITISWW